MSNSRWDGSSEYFEGVIADGGKRMADLEETIPPKTSRGVMRKRELIIRVSLTIHRQVHRTGKI